MTSTFQRARRPEQLAARRSAILTAAREALAERGVDEVTLRDISERVGLAKSNVLRYFDTREAIFLEVLAEEGLAWLVDLEERLGPPEARKPGFANEIRFADIITDTLVERRLLCELLGAMAGILERNISGDFARDFKLRAMRSIVALSELTARQLPWLSDEFTTFFGEGVSGLVAGMYPFSVPTEPVRQVMAELDFPDPHERFVDGLRTGLTTWLIGAAAQSPA
ncbi:AcrR family transcriptional regulator [Mycolicibacterium sp. BK556]|uniref:TetR/AcrR family transcriptional regulator n=1 Tax=Mycobacteriaceae TaxID=1762 RepID=UPI0010601DB6|nr:TetR family transcriptional regulator [Mycobacterium sp. BK086]MBB3603341.1 AcrR family transcriptional regulator [Mycolicibacterium sp. BK556]MBB3633536.1 AcrR family transcriptional regulator [Mycolicibacterium sp. BK607]MBB3751118.1 AcrR family transcriptional regulator [Mycolicibacterium sp. BK634]TDO11655.1 TetR family transcriptional regulator [Mycobacterium sp. BK086]